MAAITVVADDLTGALDTGVKFGGADREVVVHWRGAVPACEVLVIDTDSRALPPAVAAAAVVGWTSALGGAVYKKVDSTLRGPFAAEACALAQALGMAGVLLAPASPAVGRTVRDGRLHVGGRPLAETAFGRDPGWPAWTSEVAAIVAAQVEVPVANLGLESVRAGAEAVRAALAPRRGVVVADAETDADLLVLAQALAASPGWLATGSAGLAQALAAGRGWQPGLVSLPASALPQLVVCGSHNAISHAQVAALASALGLRPVVAGSEGDVLAALRAQWRGGGPAIGALPKGALTREEAQAALRAMVGAAARLIVDERLRAVYVTGGETLRLLADALGLAGLRVVGEVEPGVVLSRAATGGGQGLSIVSRAGGFGDADLLLRLMTGRA